MIVTSMGGEGMRIADTSFLYALFSQEDIHHERAIKDVKGPLPILIPPEILSECLALIHYRIGFPAAQTAGRWLRAQGGFRVLEGDEKTYDEIWNIFAGSKGSMSYPDAVVIAWSKKLKMSPLSYDEAIMKMM